MAPAAIAARRYPGRPNVVTMTIFPGNADALSFLATSMPPGPGISMSSTATSGWCLRAMASASSPLAACATTSMSGSSSSSATRACRTMVWSSAIMMRKLMTSMMTKSGHAGPVGRHPDQETESLAPGAFPRA